MMKKAILRVMVIILLCVLGGCAGENVVPNPSPTVAFSPTENPTDMPTPTLGELPTSAPTVEPTKEPTATPTLEPTATNTPVPTSTSTPTPTNTPTPTPSPTPSPIPTPTPSPTPSPTPTPTPTPVVSVDVEPEYIIQVGDNVWFKYYENYTLLVVSGTGATWDFKNSPLLDLDDDYYKNHLIEGTTLPYETRHALTYGVKTIVIEEGITALGNRALKGYVNTKKVVFPNSLIKVGDSTFLTVGKSKVVDWENLDFSRIETEPTSFTGALNMDRYSGSDVAVATPTPTPSPSPTPLPDPNNPKKVGTSRVTNTIDLEYWDNGYLVFVGKGHLDDVGQGITYYPVNYLADNLPEYLEADDGRFHTIVYDEGITKISYGFIGNSGIFNIKTVYLPKSFDIATCAKDTGITIYIDRLNTIHGYFNGRAVTITTSENEEVCKLAEREGAARLCEGYTLYELANVLHIMSTKGLTTYTTDEAPEYFEYGHIYFYKPTITIQWD